MSVCTACCSPLGSGKTYTFFGPDESMFASMQSPTNGVVIRTFQELIAARDFLGSNGINMSFTAQLVEIYEESVTDLLTGILHCMSPLYSTVITTHHPICVILS